MTHNWERTSKKVLVLGASGQLGTEFLSQLSERECSIVAVKRSKSEKPIRNVSQISLDLTRCEDSTLHKLIESHDQIIHLAGDTTVAANGYEIDYFHSWVQPLQRILELMIGSDKTLFFASSVSVYGLSPSFPVRENSPEQPLTSYDLAKITCDNLIKFYRQAYDVNCSSVRFSSIYGPQTTDGKPSRRILNKLLDIIHANREVSVVGSGDYFRNYIHVHDAIGIILELMENEQTLPEVVLACSTENVKFYEAITCLVDCYEKRFNCEVKINYGMDASYVSDTRSFYGSPSKCISKRVFKYDLRTGFNDLVSRI